MPINKSCMIASICRTGAWKALGSAVSDGNVKTVVELWKNDTLPVTKWEAGYYLAMHAVLKQNVEIAKLLVSKLEEHRNDLKLSEKELLRFAVSQGHSEMLDLLLEDDSQLFETNSEGQTLLHIAVLNDVKRTIYQLLQRGANLDAKDNHGYSPLHYSIMVCSGDVVRALLAHKLHVDSNTKHPLARRAITALRTAVVNQIFEMEYRINKEDPYGLRNAVCGKERRCHIIVKSFEKHGWELGKTDINDEQLMCSAIEKGYIDLVRKLLELGVNANKQISMIHNSRVRRTTPLHIAARVGRYDMAELFLSHGANVNALDSWEVAPICDAVENLDFKMIEMFLDAGALLSNHTDLVFVAAKRDNVRLLNLLLEHGVDVNARDFNGCTPLHVTIRRFIKRYRITAELPLHDCSEVFTALLNRNANVDLKDHQGMTPLHVCAHGNAVGMLIILLDRGADIHAKEVKGFNALHIAVGARSLDVMKVLLDYGADINQPNHHGDTPLHLAIRRPYREGALFLLDRNPEIKISNRNGSTPLHLAALEGMEDVCKILIKRGADVNSRRGKKSTPLHLAAKKGHVGIVDALCDAGAELNLTDRSRNTPLHLAAQDRRHDVIQNLLIRGANVNMQNGMGNTPFQSVIQPRISYHRHY